MFCKRCGTQIDENSNFCSVCGVETSTEKRTGEDGKILLVAEPQKKWCITVLIGSGIILLCSIFTLISALSIEINAFSSSIVITKRNQEIEMAVFMIAAGIFFGYEGMKWASMKLTVCENAVYGSYGIGINKQFKLTWDEIISVSGGRNSVNVIVIMVKAKSYSLVHMENAKKAVEIIHAKINQL